MEESTARWLWQSHRWNLTEAVALGRFLERVERVLTSPAPVTPVSPKRRLQAGERALPDLLMDQLAEGPQTSQELWEALDKVYPRHSVTVRLSQLKGMGAVEGFRDAERPFDPPKWRLTGKPRQALKKR